MILLPLNNAFNFWEVLQRAASVIEATSLGPRVAVACLSSQGRPL